MFLIVWQHFTTSLEANSIAVSSICETTIKRGSNSKSDTSSSMFLHLKNQQSESYKKSQRESLGKDKSCTAPPRKRKIEIRQTNLDDYKTIKPLGIKDSKAIKVHKKIMNMIAMDNKPF